MHIPVIERACREWWHGCALYVRTTCEKARIGALRARWSPHVVPARIPTTGSCVRTTEGCHCPASTRSTHEQQRWFRQQPSEKENAINDDRRDRPMAVDPHALLLFTASDSGWIGFAVAKLSATHLRSTAPLRAAFLSGVCLSSRGVCSANGTL